MRNLVGFFFSLDQCQLTRLDALLQLGIVNRTIEHGLLPNNDGGVVVSARRREEKLRNTVVAHMLLWRHHAVHGQDNV